MLQNSRELRQRWASPGIALFLLFLPFTFLLPSSLMGFSWKLFLNKSLANQCLSWDLLLGNPIQVTV